MIYVELLRKFAQIGIQYYEIESVVMSHLQSSTFKATF